jgi:hypothetical protein
MTKTKLDVIVGIICFVHENDWSKEDDFDLRPDLKAFGRHNELFGFQLHLCAALRAELATPTESGEHFLGIWWEGLLEAVLMTDRGFSEQDEFFNACSENLDRFSPRIEQSKKDAEKVLSAPEDSESILEKIGSSNSSPKELMEITTTHIVDEVDVCPICAFLSDEHPEGSDAIPRALARNPNTPDEALYELAKLASYDPGGWITLCDLIRENPNVSDRTLAVVAVADPDGEED